MWGYPGRLPGAAASTAIDTSSPMSLWLAALPQLVSCEFNVPALYLSSGSLVKMIKRSLLSSGRCLRAPLGPGELPPTLLSP